MNNQITPFDFQGCTVRAYENDGEPWFVARDVCAKFGIAWTGHVLDGIRDEWKGVAEIPTLGGVQKMAVINEKAAYKLAMRSRKPEAEAFTDFLAEVAETLRKKGRFEITPQVDWALPKNYVDALRALADKEEQAQEMARENAIMAPKAEAFDEYIGTEGTFLMREVAKKMPSLGMGQNQIYEALRSHGVIFKNGTEPYQQYINAGYFERKAGKYFNARLGNWIPTATTRVTPKGEAFIYKLLKKKDGVAHA